MTATETKTIWSSEIVRDRRVVDTALTDLTRQGWTITHVVARPIGEDDCDVLYVLSRAIEDGARRPDIFDTAEHERADIVEYLRREADACDAKTGHLIELLASAIERGERHTTAEAAR